MNYVNEIPQQAFINAEILQHIDHQADMQSAINDICVKYGLSKYDFRNHSYVISLLYCLLVIPKELWISQNKKHPVFGEINAESFISQFKILQKPKNFEEEFSYNLLHKLRNAVAHANFYTDENLNFTFWDENNGKENFRCQIDANNLLKFLSEVGALLANLRK